MISGVPQGSVLGPLLICIDGVTMIPLTEGSKLVLYADDMLLYRRLSSPEDFQNDVDAVNNWVNENRLCFNTTKCKYMLITRKKRPRPMHPPAILINGIPLDILDSYNSYLGLLISSDLSWSHHIDSICSKARRILGLLYWRFSHDTGPHALLQLYLSLVRPHLEYGSQVWDPHLQKDINQLEYAKIWTESMC